MRILDGILSTLKQGEVVVDIRQGVTFRQIRGVKLLTTTKRTNEIYERR